jgi:hypothetical protein
VIRRRTNELTADHAAAIALQGLAWLAADSDRLGRFLALTGIGPQTLRDKADEPATLLAVLDHLLGHEADLLAFCADRAIEPGLPGEAREILRRP